MPLQPRVPVGVITQLRHLMPVPRPSLACWSMIDKKGPSSVHAAILREAHAPVFWLQHPNEEIAGVFEGVVKPAIDALLLTN